MTTEEIITELYKEVDISRNPFYSKMDSQELSFAVEEKYVNLRVWIGHDGNGRLPLDTVFFRVEKWQEYSAPFPSWFKFITPEHKELSKLQKFGFKTSITNLPEIAQILSSMKYRKCLDW